MGRGRKDRRGKQAAGSPKDNHATSAPTRDQLINEFKGVIDESLVLVLTEEHSGDLNKARDILLSLAKDVAIEQESGFDPTGIACASSSDSMGLDFPEETEPSTWTKSTGGDDAGVSSPIIFTIEELAACGPEDPKLRAAFPLLSEFDIKLAFENAPGNSRKAVESLWREQFNADIGARKRGANALYQVEDHQVGKLMKKSHSTKSTKGRRTKLHVDYKLTTAELSDSVKQALQSSTHSQKSATNPSIPELSRSHSEATPATNVLDAAQAWQISSQSYSTAESAFRRGRGDPLFNQAGSFYADRSRAEAAIAREAQSREIDDKVAAQSDDFHVDLHGATTRDGVRIALEKAAAWWESLGPGPKAKAKKSPLVIVTGLGNHSKGGVSQLRQSVGAALKREGWVHTVESGRFVLDGKT